MIRIELKDVGKKFGSHWLFKNINLDINQGNKIALLGHNGSGKSTLLQIISGFLRPTTGIVNFRNNGTEIVHDDHYKYFSYAAPYMELPEELTAIEFLEFYKRHQTFMPGIDTDSIIEISFLTDSRNKIIRSFSSGMKQRLKLACALLSSTPITLLDEPLTNLDDEGVAFYKKMINEYAAEKTVLICSNNVAEETFCCSKKIQLDLK